MKFDRYEGMNGFDDAALEEWCKERDISAGLGYAIFELQPDQDKAESLFSEWQQGLAEVSGGADEDKLDEFIEAYGLSSIMFSLANTAETKGLDQLAIDLYKLSIQHSES